MSLSTSKAPPKAAALPDLLARKRTLVMGVLNVTPDSFSDGGRFLDPATALAHAKRMIDDGADIIDIGAESTRPYAGATPVDESEEMARLSTIVSDVARLGLPVSIDTMKASVAEWALSQGASLMNDVWGLQRDPAMAHVAAAHDCPIVVMHNRETADPRIDIVDDVTQFFIRSLDIAANAGIRDDNIVLDPGIGFGKTPEQSIACLANLDAFLGFGRPLLVGASRKRFIDSIVPSPPDKRLGGSIAAHIVAAQSGASIVRVHDVAETVMALRVAEAIGPPREGQA